MNKQCNCGRYLISPEQSICSVCSWDKETASQGNRLNFIAVSTVSFQNNKNVSTKRIAMIKRREVHPDGNGEVVLKNHAGKLTSRRAGDY